MGKDGVEFKGRYSVVRSILESAREELPEAVRTVLNDAPWDEKELFKELFESSRFGECCC